MDFNIFSDASVLALGFMFVPFIVEKILTRCYNSSIKFWWWVFKVNLLSKVTPRNFTDFSVNIL